MGFQSDDPDFCVSWLLGLRPQHPSGSRSSGSQFESQDPDFSVSWLLGLQPQKPLGQCSSWTQGFESRDPDFSVSWLLGLRRASKFTQCGVQWTARCPPWAEQYETNDPEFLVSRTLGLIPGLLAAPEADATLPEGESVIRDEGEVEDTYGLRIMFGEPSIEEEDQKLESEKEALKEEESSEETDDESDEEAPVLAEPGFLALCEKMEELLDEIEESSSVDDSDTESLDGLSPEEVQDESPSRIEWLRQKTIEKAENKYLDRLMSLPALEETKAFFLHAKAKVQASTRRETSLKKDNFDVIFTGNEGTGKTAMANLYARMLVSLGLVKPTSDYTGIHRVSCYQFSKTCTLSSIQNISSSCGGCIVVLDDAHLIKSKNDEPSLWSFYSRAKEIPGNVVLILAGDAGDGLSEQLEYSAEVLNHFHTIKLSNYSEEDLGVIFHGFVRRWFNKKMKVDGEVDDFYVKILMRRILRGTNEKTFANVWPLKKAFVTACRRQVERFRQARREGQYLEDYFMTKEDLLGDSPSLSPEKSPAWKELRALIGLDGVKESIEAVIRQVNQNYQRELRGQEPLKVTANRVFLGPPGTGKTTVARLYAKILADLGILSKGDVVIKNPTDLIDRYIGGSENNTKSALAEAVGGVLIIDDAHMLDPGKRSDDDKNGDFRGSILDTLVAEVSGAPGEDRCVILCGYDEQMKEMYANANPGLARRFPLDTAFVFENFDAETLGKILDFKLDKEKLTVTDKAREVAMDMLKRASVRPNFGNGAEVDNLISKAVLAQTKRIEAMEASEQEKADTVPIEPQDFDADWDRHRRAVANTRALFDGFIGYEEIIAKFESYQYMTQGMRLRGLDPRPYVPFTYVFKGPPGTGKTSTARKLGQIFYDMGFLSAPDVVEVSATALIGEYCGQTGPKTLRLLESALGKVLFIDEAYRLATPGSFTEEAVSELVDAVTKPRFARKLIIVLAGYEKDMDRLMAANRGMRSRFATELTFRPLRAEQCLEQLRRVVDRVGVAIQKTTDMDAATRNALLGALASMARDKNWASGRSAETLGEKVIAHVFTECAKKRYTGDQLVVTGKEMLSILASSGMASPGFVRVGTGPMGPRQLMTLRDLEG